MPTPACDAVKEAELEEVANAEIGDGAKIARPRNDKMGLTCFIILQTIDLSRAVEPYGSV